jgi:hypothetical protein
MIGSRGCPDFCESKRGFWCSPLAVPTTTNVRSCTWELTGEPAPSTPGSRPTPDPTRPGPDLAATHPPPLVQHPGLEDPRHRHPRRRRLGRLPPTRGPTRLVADRNSGTARHRRGGDGRRRELGVPGNGGSPARSLRVRLRPVMSRTRAGRRGQLGARRADPSVLSERQPWQARQPSRDAWPAPRDTTPTLGV